MENKIKSNNPCKRFSHMDSGGNPVFKDKVAYNTKADAQKQADRFNSQEKAIHYTVPYQCPVCHKWHIGRSVVELTDYRKRQIRNGSYTTESENQFSILRDKIANAPKIDLSKI